MPRSVLRRRATAWIATLAILLVSLLPTVQALTGKSPATWIEICSAQGNHWLAIDANGDPVSPRAGSLLDHCPYCSFQSQALALPPAAIEPVPVPGLRFERPRAFLSASHTLHAWIAASPRGPPASS